MDLSEIRQEIDKIDVQLLDLFLKRMECSRAVAEYKTKNGLPVLNEKREQEILDNAAKKSGDNANYSRLFFSTIMDISRAAQYPIVTADNSLRNEIGDAFSKRFEPKKIGCQGTEGSYAEAAANTAYSSCKINYYPSFEDVFKAVSCGEIDAGVIPVENSYAGSIVENYDYLIKYNLHINNMVNLPISHCLLACDGASADTVKQVYSHEQALNQCAPYLKKNGFKPNAMANTAIAAKYVLERNDPSIAAIASENAAELYKLNILAKGIQSSEHNSTRFVVVAKDMCISENANHISLAFSIPHVAGSLYKTLSKLASYGLNMTKIESRPDKSSPFEYIFYLDFIGSLKSDEIVGLLCAMKDELPYFKILGNY